MGVVEAKITKFGTEVSKIFFLIFGMLESVVTVGHVFTENEYHQ